MRYLFLTFLIATNAYGQWFGNRVEKQAVKELNILKNPGFENSLDGWTASGGSFTRYTGADRGFGSTSGNWDPSAAAQTLTGTRVKTSRRTCTYASH